MDKNNLKLCDFLNKIDKPILFKNILVNENGVNSATSWTPEVLESIFKNQKLEFRIGKIKTCNFIAILYA